MDISLGRKEYQPLLMTFSIRYEFSAVSSYANEEQNIREHDDKPIQLPIKNRNVY